jgi:RNA polymerase sigma-70 factor (ECF subfamily)
MLESQLIDKCKSGDGEAYRKLINIYQARLFGYLWRFSESNTMAEELFQETIIKVWKGFKKYSHQKKFSSWLFTIAHNVAMDCLRQRKNKNIFVSIDKVDNDTLSVSPEEDLIKKERVDRINNSIEYLSEKQKRVFLLRQHGELSFKEIAEATNEPINTVLSHMRYAVKKIKKQLEEENEPRQKSVM